METVSPKLNPFFGGCRRHENRTADEHAGGANDQTLNLHSEEGIRSLRFLKYTP